VRWLSGTILIRTVKMIALWTISLVGAVIALQTGSITALGMSLISALWAMSLEEN
jgi:hypothetical protein